MTAIETLRQALPEFVRDVRLNLRSLLSPGVSPELTEKQMWGTVLAAALALRSKPLAEAIEAAAAMELEPTAIEAARTAAAIMAMTNIYYRAIHMADDDDLSRLPAGLRMNGPAKHRIAQADFELFGLAASAVNGELHQGAYRRRTRERGWRPDHPNRHQDCGRHSCGSYCS